MTDWKEGKRYKFIPEIRDFVEIEYTPEKLNPDDLYWLSNKDLEVTYSISNCIEMYRAKLKENWDKVTIDEGFLGKDTKRYDDKKWEELFISSEVINCIEESTNHTILDIWKLVLDKLDPLEPYKSQMILMYKSDLDKNKKSKQASEARNTALKKDPKQLAKREVKQVWKEWRIDNDQSLMYTRNIDFAEQMKELFPDLKNTGTIERWCTEWAKEYGLKIRKGRKPTQRR